jgi:hypothetical protein
MKYVYFVSPVGSDPGYAAKRKVLAGLEAELDIAFFFPLERYSSFTVESAKADLAAASLVIADLSLERPSCYFELGIAQAAGARVAVIIASHTVLHQMGHAVPVRKYANLDEYGSVVRESINSGTAR